MAKKLIHERLSYENLYFLYDRVNALERENSNRENNYQESTSE